MLRRAVPDRLQTRQRCVLLVLLVCSVGAPSPVAAQGSFVVQGRVFDPGSGAGIQNTVLTLDSYGSVLSTLDGSFIFRGVQPGDYTLRVEAFGYGGFERSLTVRGDTVLSLPLDIDPLQLDSLNVEASTLDFDGRVRDPVMDSNLMGVVVRSSQGHEDRTGMHGRFDFDDVYEHVPLRIDVSAFGYLPLDTIFVPDDEERYPFSLVEDPFMKKMVEVQGQKLDDRASQHYYRPPVNRESMSRFMDNGSVQNVMEANYPRHILQKIGCFFIDERLIEDREERTFVLQNTFAKELQRIEFYEFPGFGRLFMVRVYTTGFYQRLVGSQRKMQIPVMALGLCR